METVHFLDWASSKDLISNAALRGYVNAYGPCGCPWAMLSPEVMLMSVAQGSVMMSEAHAPLETMLLSMGHAAAGDQGGVCGLCFY